MPIAESECPAGYQARIAIAPQGTEKALEATHFGGAPSSRARAGANDSFEGYPTPLHGRAGTVTALVALRSHDRFEAVAYRVTLTGDYPRANPLPPTIPVAANDSLAG